MRLIDADKLSEHKFPLAPLRYHVGWNDAIDAVIENAPTVDAVEVVRCKECKWSRGRNENERNYLVEGVLICTSCDAIDSCWNPVLPNHFCSYGERRDNDA